MTEERLLAKIPGEGVPGRRWVLDQNRPDVNLSESGVIFPVMVKDEVSAIDGSSGGAPMTVLENR